MNKICNILRPFCFENLQGLAIYRDDKFVILDSKKGYLATLDGNNNTTIIKSGFLYNYILVGNFWVVDY
ncbi:MAG: hypothetical protein RLZZ148_2913 [Cyanobacteriota bacterium]